MKGTLSRDPKDHSCITTLMTSYILSLNFKLKSFISNQFLGFNNSEKKTKLMLNTWYKLFSEIEPDEIRKAMAEYYEALTDEEIKELLNEEK